MFDELNLLGIVIIIFFIIYLYKLVQDGPYIHKTSQKHLILINRKVFKPKGISIKRGDTVIWSNNDVIRHTVMTKNPNIPNSNVLLPDKDWSHTFSQIGSFTFRSSLYKEHKSMIVKVEDVKKGSEFINSITNENQILMNNVPLIRTIKEFITLTFQNFLNYLKNLYKKFEIGIKNHVSSLKRNKNRKA